ncbi:asparagine synthase-related protein [Agrobacterium tumefaciens]|uniref:Asparagine synthetase domain-containing protein n=1 Tax=Agrobacterium tumefaciens TaxID=358 RepID=A0A4D7YVM4_AGRTU|nr:hypothetical protein CFBP7129_26590 [Agrobacterium tumefaciens]
MPARPRHWCRKKRNEHDQTRPFITTFSAENFGILRASQANGFKIALSGDGSDEIFAGYDLFKTTNDPHALSTCRLNNVYRTDLQRTDRSSMAIR